MIPIGTRVVVAAARTSRPQRLNGRIGTVTEHIEGDDCPNVVTGLHRFERFLGLWQFADDELELDHSAPAADAEPTETPTNPVVMRFLTQGGAPVELHTQTFRKPINSRQDNDGNWIHDWQPAQGFNWRCTGCHTVGKESYLGAYDEHKPNHSRDEANRHAEICRAMPPLTATLG